jgi:hypothetical protein
VRIWYPKFEIFGPRPHAVPPGAVEDSARPHRWSAVFVTIDQMRSDPCAHVTVVAKAVQRSGVRPNSRVNAFPFVDPAASNSTPVTVAVGSGMLDVTVGRATQNPFVHVPPPSWNVQSALTAHAPVSGWRRQNCCVWPGTFTSRRFVVAFEYL